MLTLPKNAPPAYHVLVKPTGAVCNLDCKYCFFLSKEMLYPGSRFRMADDLLETYLRQLLESHTAQEVIVAWQGGEPTLMGLDFFERSVELAEKYRKPGQTIQHTIQTNGTKLDDEWCAFFRQHSFLVGLSVDGPRRMHDTFRVNKGGTGSFDQGWDKLREEIFARQKSLGVIPADAELTVRPQEIPAWDDMPEVLKPVLARQMEVYAGYMEHTDHQVGRVIDALEDLHILDDTLVIYITGDNGACVGGGLTGTFNWMITLNGARDIESPEFMAARIDKFGTPDALNHYAIGWAHAMNTPYQWVKQVASHWGGTRNGTIIHWPNGIKAKGGIRTQFSHVIDVASTVLEAAGIPEPAFVNGIQQMPLQGQSMIPSFDDAGAPEFRTTQYFEIFGNRGIYHQGWSACTKHGSPWQAFQELPLLDDDEWELYSSDDHTQAHNLAKEMPEKLHELQRLFVIEAVRNNVLPIDDRKMVRFNADLAGRPELVRGNTQMLYSGMIGLPENVVLNLKNKSHAITAQLVIPKDGATGVIVAQGGEFGGWSLYTKDGRPTYCYNLLGLQYSKIEDKKAIPAGEHQVRMEFAYDGGGLGKGATISLFIDGEKTGEGRIDRSTPMIFSLDDKTDVGSDRCTPVSDDYGSAESVFNGRIDWIQIDLGEDAQDADHLITPEERYNLAMALQ